MKKTIMLAYLIVGVSLVGCGAKNDNKKEIANETTTEKTTTEKTTEDVTVPYIRQIRQECDDYVLRYNGQSIELSESTKKCHEGFQSPSELSVLDVNEDGKDDIVFAKPGFREDYVSVILATDDGYVDLGLISEYAKTSISVITHEKEHMIKFKGEAETYTYPLSDKVIAQYESIAQEAGVNFYELATEPREDFYGEEFKNGRIYRTVRYSELGICLNKEAQITISVSEAGYKIEDVTLVDID